MRWQWQIQGEPDTPHGMAMDDIDLFNTTIGQIAGLRANNCFVACYFPAGPFERWHNDATALSEQVAGNTLEG
jgi:hypothetical protein|tara:strand:+ start:512 stop:730 length:219 start_codon:yes stop_codon:yes gene_type:complete